MIFLHFTFDFGSYDWQTFMNEIEENINREVRLQWNRRSRDIDSVIDRFVINNNTRYAVTMPKDNHNEIVETKDLVDFLDEFKLHT